MFRNLSGRRRATACLAMTMSLVLLGAAPKVKVNADTGGMIDFRQAVSGLSPDTLYRAQFCGFGDRNVAPPGWCVGPFGGTPTLPGEQPDPADLSATQNFRTASAGTSATIDIGRVLSTADTPANPIAPIRRPDGGSRAGTACAVPARVGPVSPTR